MQRVQECVFCVTPLKRPLPRAPIDLARRGAWSDETTHAPRVPDMAVAAHRRAQPISKTFSRGVTSARATRSLRYTREHIMEQKRLILAHIQLKDQCLFDAKTCIAQYEQASAEWHASLASGLRTAYGKAKAMKRSKPPLPSQATGPERIRLAMRICHHWHKLKQAQWGESTPPSSTSVLLRRLRHIHDGALLWGTSISPPPVALTWAENDHTIWVEWAIAIIPAINRFLISPGVAHTHGTFCTHPIGNETRLQLGPSLGGALRPGGTNTMIDGLELPSTGDRQERWNCSDQDLRRHMALEIMKLSSDKTIPSKKSAHSAYPFTMAAKEVLFDPGEQFSFPPHPTALETPRLPREEADVDSDAEQLDETETPDPREPPYMPSAPHDARTRGKAKVLLLNSLRKDIGTLTQLPWTEHGVWSSLASVTTRAKTLGFVVPSWVETMQKVTAILILRIDLHTHFDSQKNPANCDLTHILNKYSSSCTDPYLREVPREAICDKLRAHWSSWAAPIATQSASIATHLERSSGSLSEALQPPLDPAGTIALAFSDCLRNYSDIDDLHKSLMLMPSASTGGMMGLTREHLSHAPDEIKRWILELTGGIFAGLSPSVLKLGVVAPLPKDAKRFRPVTLLEPITKLVTGTVARRLSLLLHKHSLLHQHQFGFVHGGSCEAPIEIVNDMSRAVGIGAVLVKIGSVPTDHSLAHIPPLPVSDMRPLALEADDPLQVNVWKSLSFCEKSVIIPPGSA